MKNCSSWLHHSIPLTGEAVEPRCNVFAIPPSVVSFISLMNLPPCLPFSHGSVAHGSASVRLLVCWYYPLA